MSRTFLLTINRGLVIGGVLPSLVQVGTAFYGVLVPYGGIAPYAWSISVGSLPDGVSASQDSDDNFVFTGTTTDAGDFEFTVKLLDSEGRSVIRTFSIRILPLALTISGSAPDGAVGDPFNYTYTVDGGIAPYFPYLIVGGGFGPLPDGLILDQDSNGDVIVTGTPDVGSGGTYTFKIGVDDSQDPAAFAFVVNTITITDSATFNILTESSLVIETEAGNTWRIE